MGKKLKSNIDTLFKNKKIIIISLCIMFIIIGLIVVIMYFNNNNSNNDNSGINVKTNNNANNNTNYDSILTMINNNDTFLIYYYNSKSENKNNKDIKKYLDGLGIKYYSCDDASIEKKQYDEFMKLVDIDKDLFGVPALIYIKNGKMYGNIINVDSKTVVKRFISDYDLYTVK